MPSDGSKPEAGEQERYYGYTKRYVWDDLWTHLANFSGHTSGTFSECTMDVLLVQMNGNSRVKRWGLTFSFCTMGVTDYSPWCFGCGAVVFERQWRQEERRVKAALGLVHFV